MDESFKISQLWQYLKIKDNEILIIKSFNQSLQNDVYYVVTKVNDELKIQVYNYLPEMSLDKPFQIFQHIGPDGKHYIPSVEQLEKDKEMDY